MIQTWQTSFLTFWDRRILAVFLLGFSSGLPFLLTLSTLTIWLKETGVSNTTIGLFVMVTLPYTFKFIWGPMVDRVKLPLLTPALGQRRSWILLAQIALFLMLLGLGRSNPEKNILVTALWAFGVAFCSALQDIVIEAYRIEIIDKEQQNGSAATASNLGYRLGMMTAGAGALYLAAIFSWQTAYACMAFLIGIGFVTTLLSPSPLQAIVFKPLPLSSLKGSSLFQWVRSIYGAPLKDLMHPYNWRIILTFILFYKVGDTLLNVMSAPFLVELGFSKVEMADVAKLFGISSMIVGGFIGGIFLNRFGILLSLMLCAVLQILSSLMFLMQALVGYDLNVLILTIGIENLTCGLGAVSYIAYLSSLCRMPYTATHFALLSSFGSLARIFLSIGAGLLADLLSWPLFFTFTAAACVPCLFLLIQASHHFPHKQPFLKPAF